MPKEPAMPADPVATHEMTTWRRDLHAHPEFGFEERRTSAFVAAKLREFGLDEVAEGVGGTGVVGTLKRGTANRSVALRADMDALRITEQGEHDYVSQTPGTMHACGHDGHTAMLLGAAKQLAAQGGFDGTVRFVFQPAEEWGRGALAMLADDSSPADALGNVVEGELAQLGGNERAGAPLLEAEFGMGVQVAPPGGHLARCDGIGGHGGLLRHSARLETEMRRWGPHRIGGISPLKRPR
jgi:hypothetical protein